MINSGYCNSFGNIFQFGFVKKIPFSFLVSFKSNGKARKEKKKFLFFFFLFKWICFTYLETHVSFSCVFKTQSFLFSFSSFLSCWWKSLFQKIQKTLPTDMKLFQIRLLFQEENVLTEKNNIRKQEQISQLLFYLLIYF